MFVNFRPERLYFERTQDVRAEATGYAILFADALIGLQVLLQEPINSNFYPLVGMIGLLGVSHLVTIKIQAVADQHWNVATEV